MSYGPGKSGKCPHCEVHVRFELVTASTDNVNRGQPATIRLITPSDHSIVLTPSACPACGKPTVYVERITNANRGTYNVNMLIWPDTADRPIPPEVEAEAPELAADYREAVSVLPKSRKASAALARRCLQFILERKGGTTKRNLADQIEEVLGNLPQQLALNVDAIRHVGNFAAHPIKAESTGQIVDVEEGEAEWLLEVLEDLFDYYYVAPAAAEKRRAELNKKLTGMGKPALKTPAGS